MEKQIEKYGALTPEEVRLRRAAEIVETQLLQMRGQMEGIRARMLRGDLRALKDSAKITSDIRQWLRIAMETEAKLDEFRKKSRGEADGVHGVPPLNWSTNWDRIIPFQEDQRWLERETNPKRSC